MGKIYFKKLVTYIGSGKAKNKFGNFIEGRFRIEINSNGNKVKKSFEDILIEIFKKEKYKYSKKELKNLIEIRNLVIHEASGSSKKRNVSIKKTFRTYYSSLRLFEKFILNIIKYKGQYIMKTSNKGFNWVDFKS